MKKSTLSTAKISARKLSLVIGLLLWFIFSMIVFFIIRGMWDRARLIRDNENEQLFNTLFTSLRNHDDFGSAIEADPVLMERISGFAVYNNDLFPVYSWGEAPSVFDENMLLNNEIQGGMGRYTVSDKKQKSVKFVIRTDNNYESRNRSSSGSRSQRNNTRNNRSSDSEPAVRETSAQEQSAPDEPSAHGPLVNEPQVQVREPRNRDRQQFRTIERQGFPFFNMLARGRYFYFDVNHPAYWRTLSFGNFLLPFCCLAIFSVIFYIRHLYLRNMEYRERIEAQKNLVVLGTATGTLAHEIKTPLSSIRLQTGILEKINPDGKEEIAIINEEVDRLASLSRRINDYIREGSGNPARIDLCELINEAGLRLCGRKLIEPDSIPQACVFADPERLRSVFENLIRNALESGGSPDEVSVSVTKSSGSVNICVLDRGKSISKDDLEKVFEPFFTRKSSGTGIGLSICKRFTEAAGGSISIKNREGGGVEAVVIFQGESGESPPIGGVA